MAGIPAGGSQSVTDSTEERYRKLSAMESIQERRGLFTLIGKPRSAGNRRPSMIFPIVAKSTGGAPAVKSTKNVPPDIYLDSDERTRGKLGLAYPGLAVQHQHRSCPGSDRFFPISSIRSSRPTNGYPAVKDMLRKRGGVALPFG